jgi:hypothetical protein
MKVEILKKDSKKGFALLAGINRTINPGHVTKLAKSVDKTGVTRPVLVAKLSFMDGKETFYIIDGQHLYMVCLRNNIDIPYHEIEIKDLEDLVEVIALHNASSKSWTLADYIQSWKIIHKDYGTLQSLFQRYDIELNQLAQILHSGYTVVTSSLITKTLKLGGFRINDLDRSILILDRITDALKLVPRMDRMSNKTFISAYSSYCMQATYDHKKTLSYLKTNKDKFVLATQDPEEFNKLLHNIK